MYRIRQPTDNLHQIASKCTDIEFQNFSWGNAPKLQSAGGSTSILDWESEKVASLEAVKPAKLSR